MPLLGSAKFFQNGMRKILFCCFLSAVQAFGLCQPLQADDEIPIGYQEAKPWGNQLLKVRRGKSYGLLRKSGEVVLNADYSRISDLNCYGKAILQKGSKYGVISADGEILVPADYKALYDFIPANQLPEDRRLAAYGNARVSLAEFSTLDTLLTDAKYLRFKKMSSEVDYIIDDHANIILKDVSDIVSLPVNGMMRWWMNYSTFCAYGYYNIDSQQKITVSNTFGDNPQNLKVMTDFSHGDFIGDIAPVRGESSFFFVNKNGEKVKEGYDVQCNATEDIWVFRKDGQCEIVNSQGEALFADKGYADLHFPPADADQSLMAAKSNGKWGVVTMDGQQVLPFKYDDAELLTNGLVRVASSGLWGVVDFKGKTLVPCAYMDIEVGSDATANACWVETSDSLYHIFLIKEQKLLPAAYTRICSFENGYAWAQPNDSLYLNRSQVAEGVLYGVVVGVDGRTYFSTPIKLDDYPMVLDYIHDNGDKPLGSLEGRRLFLYMTRNQRSYRFEDVIPEEEWDY